MCFARVKGVTFELLAQQQGGLVHCFRTAGPYERLSYALSLMMRPCTCLLSLPGRCCVPIQPLRNKTWLAVGTP